MKDIPRNSCRDLVNTRQYGFPGILFVAVIGSLLIAGCLDSPDPAFNPNLSATILSVGYDRPVYADYGTGDCFFRDDIPGQTILLLKTGNCPMNYARFSKTGNDTSPGILRADLIRDGHIIKSYSTGTGSVSFENIDKFLVLSAQDPGLVQDSPITVTIAAEGAWAGQVTDAYGGQSERRIGPANLTLNQPVPPVMACVISDSVPDPVTVGLYREGLLLNRSDLRNPAGKTCAVFR